MNVHMSGCMAGYMGERAHCIPRYTQEQRCISMFVVWHIEERILEVCMLILGHRYDIDNTTYCTLCIQIVAAAQSLGAVRVDRRVE